MESKLKLNNQKELKLKTFLIAFISSVCMFLPFLLLQGGTFTYYGDFTIQTLPFNILNNDLIKSGDTGWCWYNGLGSDFLTSFSYYTLGSPFFYLMLLFPSSFVPYLVAPIICLKIALMALAAYIYIRQYVNKPSSAMIGGLLYAFSGWMIYNLFFFVFLDAAIFFPLILWALDNLVKRNTRCILAAVVALMAIDNFYFFIEIGIFTFIYFLIRTITKSWDMNLKKFFYIFFEVVLGIIMASFILIPSILTVLNMPRSTAMLSGWSLFAYSKPVDYLKIISGFFLPTQTPGMDVFFGEDYSLSWSSISFYLPFVSMIGVIAWCKENKKHWITILIGLFTVFLFVPCLNNLFNMENVSIYMRWTFMLVLFLALSTVKAFEDKKYSFKKSTIIVLIITLVIIITTLCFVTERKTLTTLLGFFLYASIFIAIASILIFAFIIKQRRINYKRFVKNAVYCIVLTSLLSGWLTFALGACLSYDYKTKPKEVFLQSDLKLPGNKDEYRITSAIGFSNFNMIEKYQTTETFQTFVAPSTLEFYSYLDYKLGAGFFFWDNNSVITFLSNKYYITNPDGRKIIDLTESSLNKKERERECLLVSTPVNKKGELTFEGYKKINETKWIKVYENENFIPYGFTYDYYYLEADTDKLTSEEKSTLLLKGVMLNEEQAEKYKNILGRYEVNKANLAYDYNNYKKDCDNLKNNPTATNFKMTDDGFTCEFQDEKENLVFFSIPYDDGWTAYVDGKETEIEKVNKGFMAVDVSSGKHTIEFKYKNNIARYSGYVSVIGLIIFWVYESLILRKRRSSYGKKDVSK